MKIAICTPVHGDTKAAFTQSLALMVGYSAGAMGGVELHLNIQRGHLPDIRNVLAENAIEWGAAWILWLDADHSFPADTLKRLLAHEKDAVGCNYPKRGQPQYPVAVRDGQPLHTTEALAKAGKLDEVDSLGLGVCLVRASVFSALEKPWFTFEPRENGRHASEDVTFFRRLRAAGISAFIDHALSWQIGHISECVLSNADTRGDYVNTILPSAGDR